MTDSISNQMYETAVQQAEQAAVAAMERDLAFARHIRSAMDLVAPVQRVADDRDAVYLGERGEWVR